MFNRFSLLPHHILFNDATKFAALPMQYIFARVDKKIKIQGISRVQSAYNFVYLVSI